MSTISEKTLQAGLIDDIFTTGATVSCASDALINAGAERIYVLSIARA